MRNPKLQLMGVQHVMCSRGPGAACMAAPRRVQRPTAPKLSACTGSGRSSMITAPDAASRLHSNALQWVA